MHCQASQRSGQAVLLRSGHTDQIMHATGRLRGTEKEVVCLPRSWHRQGSENQCKQQGTALFARKSR